MLKDIILKNMKKEEEKKRYDNMRLEFSDSIEIEKQNGEKKYDKAKR